MTTKKNNFYGTAEMERDYGPLTFANVLRAHRECEEMPQTEMAKFLGISKQSLYDLEKGRKIPSPARAASIAKKLGMLPESFIKLAFQDQLRTEKLNYEVTLKKVKGKIAA